MSSYDSEILEARIPRSEVPAVYGRLAPRYDFWARRAEAKVRARCLELAAIRDGEAVLEVGVGTGLLFLEILKRNPHGRNEGIDITEEMLARARKRALAAGVPSYRLEIGDAYHLTHPGETFDLLVNTFMFDLLPVSDFPIVLAEFSRVLKGGGRLVIANMARGKGWLETVWERIYRVRASWLGGCRPVRLAPFLEAAGFRIENRELVSELGLASEVIRASKS